MGKSQSQSDEKLQEALKKSGEIPAHIAIIMDGNGRWAKKRGLPRVAGHKRGVDTVKEITETCAELGVKYLTSLYFFNRKLEQTKRGSFDADETSPKKSEGKSW